MKIDGIENGIVLDHIKAGKSMLLYRTGHYRKLHSGWKTGEQGDSVFTGYLKECITL